MASERFELSNDSTKSEVKPSIFTGSENALASDKPEKRHQRAPRAVKSSP